MGGGSSVQVSPGERQLADLAQQQWNDYKAMYQPLDKQLLARAKDKNRNRTKGINIATGGAGQAFDAADANAMKGLSAAGVNPNSGKGVSVISSMKRGRGTSVGKSGVSANIAADQRYAGRMFNAAAHGRGSQGIALNGIYKTAALSNQNAIADANYRTQQNTAMVNGISTVAGAGIGMGARRGANGEQSGFSAYGNARNAGATISEALGIGWDQTMYNNRGR